MSRKIKSVKRAGGGGRLGRSEITTVRLDPKLRFAAELASRIQRRTVSSVLEIALIDFLASQSVTVPGESSSQPLLKLIERLWDPHEEERFVNFAHACSWLLNAEEDRRWKLIKVVLGVHDKLTPKQRELLHENYEKFVATARGEMSESALVKLRIAKSGE